MASVTTRVLGPSFRYSHTIGRVEMSGEGFLRPVAVARGIEDRLYVVSRANGWRRHAIRVTMCTVGEDYLGEFGHGSTDVVDTVVQKEATDGSLLWPTSINTDSRGNVYVADEWFNRISIFSADGEWTGKWGRTGPGDGELNGPSGIAFDSQDNLYVVDSKNHRIQKFTADGNFLLQWGRAGDGDGEFNLPWGIEVDQLGNVYVADWRNDRIQKFTGDGLFLMKFGRAGKGDGEFNRPTNVAVDRDGVVYVTDWGNDRLQVFDRQGQFVTTLTGDATISRWGKEKLDSNADMWPAREVAQSLEREKRFAGAIAVEVDQQGRILVAESARNRVQVYRKIGPSFLGLYDNSRL